MIEIKWEFADKSPHWDFDIAINEPALIRNHLPDWIKTLRGNIREYYPKGFGLDHTARHCLGLQGLSQVGFTCPLPVDIHSNDYNHTPWGGLNFHPYTLFGTKWAEVLEGNPADEHLHNYQWNIRLLEWPWRAKIPKKHKLLMTGNMLEWNDDYSSFSGVVPKISPGDQRAEKFSAIMDPEFDYFALENVIAIKTGKIIPAGTCIFNAVVVPEFTVDQ